jgi:SAM-dependent methyltransferase
VAPEKEQPALEALRDRLDEEEAAYSEVLAAVDRLASFPLPAETAPEVRERLGRLNALWSSPERPVGGGLGGAFRRRAWDAVSPALERQSEFNAALVQLLNAHLGPLEALHAHLRELAGAVVCYVQRVQPLVDARARVASSLATARSELVLEAFDRRIESLGRRFEGLLALRDRLEAVTPEAGEDRRGEQGSEQRRRRLEESAALLGACAPVVDLASGSGELLEALRAAGVDSRGLDSSAPAVRECQEKGLDVVQDDPVAFLRAQPEGSLGGLFGEGIVERLPPAALPALLEESHRTLRSGGRLLLEVGDPRSVAGLSTGARTDLDRVWPVHPDALSALAEAAGFAEVRIELRSATGPDERLQPVPSEGLPERTARVLNENLGRLNALLYGPLGYALLARR